MHVLSVKTIISLICCILKWVSKSSPLKHVWYCCMGCTVVSHQTSSLSPVGACPPLTPITPSPSSPSTPTSYLCVCAPLKFLKDSYLVLVVICGGEQYFY